MAIKTALSAAAGPALRGWDCRDGRPGRGRWAAGGGQREKVAVTGATGFVGVRLVEMLQAAGYDVVALTRDPLLVVASAGDGVISLYPRESGAFGAYEGIAASVEGGVTLVLAIESCVTRLEKRGDPRVPTRVGRALELTARFAERSAPVVERTWLKYVYCSRLFRSYNSCRRSRRTPWKAR